MVRHAHATACQRLPVGEHNNVTTSLTADLPVLTADQLDADPHRTFRSWRATHPVVAHEAGSYVVLRYADVERISKDPRVCATETGFPKMLGVTEGALYDGFELGMLTANGEVHRRRRSPFSRTFAPRMIAELRPRMRQAAEELIADWCADESVEFVDRFAAQVPARVISSLLGLPREDIPEFISLVYQVTKFLSLSVTQEEIPFCEAAARQPWPGRPGTM